MAQVASDPLVSQHLPVVKHSLLLAASPQIRNMATLGGNVLQRTRSPYFRHIDFPDSPPSDNPPDAEQRSAECDLSTMAILGHNGRLLGTYPGDFAVSLVALGGQLHLKSRDSTRIVKAREFFVAPTDQSTYTTLLKEHEIIEALSLPLDACGINSLYFKVRERSSYAFALASAAVAMELTGSGQDAKIVEAKIALGGIATVPWASPEAEGVLRGQAATTDDVFEKAAEAALKAAQPAPGLEYKVTLAKRVLVRALQALRDEGVPSEKDLWAFQHGRHD